MKSVLISWHNLKIDNTNKQRSYSLCQIDTKEMSAPHPTDLPIGQIAHLPPEGKALYTERNDNDDRKRIDR